MCVEQVCLNNPTWKMNMEIVTLEKLKYRTDGSGNPGPRYTEFMVL